MRNCRVERFNPSRMAAPWGPASTHRVFFRVARMCARSASSSVCGFQLSVHKAGRSDEGDPLWNRVKQVSTFASTDCSPHRAPPDEWNEAEGGVEAVFRIAGQFLAKNLFLIEQAENDDGNEEGKDR